MRLEVFACAVLTACSLIAQDRFVYPLPDPAKIVARKDNVLHGDLKFDVYRPAGDAIVPVVIFANIGSSAYTTWPIYIGWGKAVAGAGLAGVVYQATQENATGDFDALMAALRAKAGQLHIDPSRVVIWCASSNVQIGLPLAMDRKRDSIRSAVVYYGVAPVESIRTDLPVFFVRSGLDEPSFNARIDAMLAKALAANAPWTIESYGAGMHAFDSWNDNDVSREIIDRTLAFMKSSLRLSPAYAALAEQASIGAAFARGEWQTAIDGYRRYSDPESHRRLGIALMQTKQYPEALQELERAYELGRRGIRDTAYPAALAAAGAHNVDRAVYWLDLVLSSRFAPPMDQIRADFATLKDESAFQALIAKHGK
jgi:dienelactone hydrolase